MSVGELTKEQIFNMSDEEFNKHFSDLMNSSPAANNAPLLDSNNLPPSKEEEGNKGEENQGKVDDNTQTPNQVDNKSLDNEKKIWDNFANVNQKGSEGEGNTPSPQDDESKKDITSDGTSNEGEEPTEDNKPSEQQVFEVKSYGQKYSFTLEELKQLAPKALHFTKKMQKLAPYRRTISAMEENGITEDDVNQFIEMKKGNKTAVANFLSKNNIDAYEVSIMDTDETSKYQPFKFGVEDNELTRVTEDLQYHPRSRELTDYVRTLDSESLTRLKAHPDVLNVLMSHIENGMAEKFISEANKRAFLQNNRKPMIEYYAEVATEYYNYIEAQEKAKLAQQKQVNEKDLNAVREQTKVSGTTGARLEKKPPREIKSASDITLEELEAFERDMGFI